MTPTTRKLAPVLYVDDIEPCLPLWLDNLGWIKVAEVPHGSAIGFVILQRDGAELMYQTWSSVEEDLGRKIPRTANASVGLFIEVSNIDEIERQLASVPITLPRRRTFYGMDEIGVTEGGGHTVIFAQRVAPQGERPT